MPSVAQGVGLRYANLTCPVRRPIAEHCSFTYVFSMASLRDDFLRFVSQTSPEPMGVEVSTSHGCIVVDTTGKEYLDLQRYAQ